MARTDRRRLVGAFFRRIKSGFITISRHLLTTVLATRRHWLRLWSRQTTSLPITPSYCCRNDNTVMERRRVSDSEKRDRCDCISSSSSSLAAGQMRGLWRIIIASLWWHHSMWHLTSHPAPHALSMLAPLSTSFKCFTIDESSTVRNALRRKMWKFFLER